MNRRKLLFFLLFFCFTLTGGSNLLFGQTKAVLDTLQNRVALLAQLSQAGNFEQAQVEVESIREYMRKYKIPFSPKIVTVVSDIYKANEDDRSATRFLSEAELDARKDPNPVSRAALLNVLVKECNRWDLPKLALTCQQLLEIARDSIDARGRRSEALGLQLQLDSIKNLREAESALEDGFIRIEKKKAYGAALAAGLVFLILLFSNFLTANRWRKILDKKELEWDMLRSNLRREAEEQAFAQARQVREEIEQNTPEKSAPVPSSVIDPYKVYHGPQPEQIALLIETNRQVVLYLKSLLSDRFQVETAKTPAEALKMANELLPDLIVCNTILNGKTGINIARQIKLSERTNHIPIVLLTDKFGNDGKLDALRAGAEAWFTRPVIDDEFDDSVQRLLDVRKVRHEQFNRSLQLYFTDHRTNFQDPFLATTVYMIEQNLANPDFLPDDIARKMQMTNAHYAKKLKALSGKEPVQLIRELRLEKAKVLLEKRAGTPQAISELVGFSNPGTFSLAFKEYFGENTLLLYTPPPRLN